MRKMLAILFVVVMYLLLAGCSGAPQSREAGSTTVISVLGVAGEPGDMTVTGAAEGRGDRPPAVLQGRGVTPAAGVEDLSQNGEQVADCAHIEHLLLAEDAGEVLPELLAYAFQEPQLSTETQLWITAGDMSAVFAPERDPAKRMGVLKSRGKDRLGFAPVTLREAASALAEGESLLLPYLLNSDEGLDFGGFALWRDGRIAGRFTGAAARGAALLSGERVHWVSGNLSLQSGGCRITPLIEDGRLEGLSVSCNLGGVAAGGWQAAGETIQKAEQTAEGEIRAALERMRELGGDGIGLKRRAGAGDTLHWGVISRQFAQVFALRVPEVSVHVSVAERF